MSGDEVARGRLVWIELVDDPHEVRRARSRREPHLQDRPLRDDILVLGGSPGPRLSLFARCAREDDLSPTPIRRM